MARTTTPPKNIVTPASEARGKTRLTGKIAKAFAKLFENGAPSRPTFPLFVSDVVPFGVTDERLLFLAASAEARNFHVFGRTIVAEAIARGIAPSESHGFASTAGRGIAATVDGHKITCGNRKSIDENCTALTPEQSEQVERLHVQGKTVILVADGEECIGAIALTVKRRF